MKSSSFRKTPVRQRRLDNGLTLLHLHTRRDPVSACHLFLPGGASRDSDAEAGLTSLRWSLLLKGTSKRSARRLAEDIDSLGASIGGGATQDYSEISCHAVSHYFLKVLKIMGEVLFDPVFEKDEISKEKDALIAGIRSKKESIFSTASEDLNRRIYPRHPYGRPASGYEDSVPRLGQPELMRWQEKFMVPNDAILAVASDLSFDRLYKEINLVFGSHIWPKGKKSGPAAIPAARPVNKASHVTLKKQFEQAFLMIGFPTAGINSNDYIPLKILNACLGGGMSTRLFQELREKQGLAYDVGSFYPSKMKGSAFVIYLGLQAARLPEAKKKIFEILGDIQQNGISQNELELVKNSLKGSYLLDHQTNSQRAHYLGWWGILGKTLSYDHQYLDLINNVSAPQVRKIARTLFRRPAVSVEIHPKAKAAALPGLHVA